MSDTDWYLVDRAGRRYGPYDREVVESLVQRQELLADTPVWHPGLATWRAAGTVIAGLEGRRVETPAPRKPVPVVSAVARPAAVGRPVKAKAAPVKVRAPATATARAPVTAAATLTLWQRGLAAAFDLLLVATVLQLLVRLVSAPPWLATPRAALLGWAGLEGWLLAASGRTPGKSLFGVSVHRKDGSRLDQRAAWLRSAALPFVLLVLPLGALTVLLAGGLLLVTAARLRAGHPAWWDEMNGTTVTVDALPPARRALALLASGALIIILLLARAEYS